MFPFVDISVKGAVFPQVDRQEPDSHQCQCQRVSVCLETVKPTFFLLGSNLAREEIRATKRGVSLLRPVEPVQKHRPVVGRLMSQPMNVVDRVQFTVIYSLYDHNK